MQWDSYKVDIKRVDIRGTTCIFASPSDGKLLLLSRRVGSEIDALDGLVVVPIRAGVGLLDPLHKLYPITEEYDGGLNLIFTIIFRGLSEAENIH